MVATCEPYDLTSPRSYVSSHDDMSYQASADVNTTDMVDPSISDPSIPLDIDGNSILWDNSLATLDGAAIRSAAKPGSSVAANNV